MQLRSLAPILLAVVVPVACNMVTTHELDAPPVAIPETIDPPVIPADAVITLNSPGEAHAQLCQPDDLHPNFPDDADLLTMTFCQDLVPGGVMPTPHSLADLLAQLGLAFEDPQGHNGQGGNPAFAILGHSSALTARHVTTITPTVFVFTPPPADGSPPQGTCDADGTHCQKQFAIVGFDPGQQFVEVAVNDLAVGTLNFYVVFFDQACNSAPGGCTTTDLLTPRLVTGWTDTRVYEMTTALGNTIFDCHVCHQPDNSSPNSFLRMQEIEPPFTHWFSSQTAGGQALLADFHAAHGTSEDYGPVPAALIDQSDPSLLAAFIQQAAFGPQPNAFQSAQIEAEVEASAPQQPAVNVPPGASDTWQSLHENAVAGAFIATPYHDVKITDPVKLATASAAYQQFLAGAATDIPDIRDVLLDQGLRDMGFAPQLALTGRQLLGQMCQECHNSNLDLTQTRQRFLVDQLDQMSRKEKDLAITRLNLGMDTRLRMPPPLFRTITDHERQLMIQELQQ
jgi:mono/diheme cytochrome c family protein